MKIDRKIPKMWASVGKIVGNKRTFRKDKICKGAVK